MPRNHDTFDTGMANGRTDPCRNPPKSFVVALGSTLLLLFFFVFSAPWTIGGREIGRLTPALGAVAAVLLAALVIPSWRRYLEEIARRPHRRRVLFGILFLGSLAFGLRVVFSQFRSLNVNAWDFSAFDLPIHETVGGHFLYSPIDHRSFLGTHASYILALLVPLHALKATPYWLLIIQALAISLATAASFLVFRDIVDDDASALLLSLGYLLNTYTAKTLQFVFHVEVLYPLAIFLLVRSLLRHDRLGASVAAICLLSIKEDAVLIAIGIGCVLLLTQPGRWREAGALIGAGLVVYLVSTRIVMPRAAGGPADVPWYAPYWAHYGPSSLTAAAGIVRHPARVLGDLRHSGVRDLFEPLLFLPILGPWTIAALPGLITYGIAANPGVSHFSLYYSAPVLPILFIGGAQGTRRLAGLLPWKRTTPGQRVQLLALAVFIACALDGASYVFRRSNPRRLDVPQMIRMNGEGPIRVQGSLFPHAGYAQATLPLDSLTVTKAESVLLDDSSDPYPFTHEQLGALASTLERRGYRRCTSEHGLVLLSPP